MSRPPLRDFHNIHNNFVARRPPPHNQSHLDHSLPPSFSSSPCYPPPSTLRQTTTVPASGNTVENTSYKRRDSTPVILQRVLTLIAFLLCIAHIVLPIVCGARSSCIQLPLDNLEAPLSREIQTPLNMLLPSALPCDFRATPQSVTSPVRRSLRHAQQAIPSSYRSPPLDEAPSFLSSAPAGLFQTCRRLQQALSVDRLSTPSPVTPKKNGVQKRRQHAATTPINPAAAPSTPRRPALRTPAIGKNKRARAVAFPVLFDENACEMEGVESENSDHEFRDPFTTPRNKRVRLTAPPSPPNRNLRAPREDKENEDLEWSLDEDKQLVEMVLGKLKLSKNDWEECAKSFGKKDAKSLGKRWEGLISSRKVGLKDKRKRRN